VTAVAQGNKEFFDVIDMKLDKVVEMIRGKKGTSVRLQIIPSQATDPSERTIIEIVRDEIKLKEQEAKAEIIEKASPSGQPLRLGFITLPSFYADMEHLGAKNAKSTTRDVLALLNRLKQENISGLIVDLRRDGGGSLEEAVNLTGLFIKKGPVVQAKDNNGNVHVSRDRDSTIAYNGPLVVLTNRLSASASEIFAAALQDYGRAVAALRGIDQCILPRPGNEETIGVKDAASKGGDVHVMAWQRRGLRTSQAPLRHPRRTCHMAWGWICFLQQFCQLVERFSLHEFYTLRLPSARLGFWLGAALPRQGGAVAWPDLHLGGKAARTGPLFAT
jgi:hypothetical protein